MKTIAQNQQIDYRTLRIIVGIIAVTLPVLTSLFSSHSLTSISMSYYEDGWSRNIFVGFLFSIGAFLLSYNGTWPSEMPLSKIAAVSALCIAMFPFGSDNEKEIIPYVHGVSAAIMFGILTYFCYGFYKRSRVKDFPEAKQRSIVYAICGIIMGLSVVVLAIDQVVGDSLKNIFPRLTFYGEAVALVAFGISWLVASTSLPFISRKSERVTIIGNPIVYPWD